MISNDPELVTLREHEYSGARLVVPFTPFKWIGPKHHAIVVGIDERDGRVWIAELSRRFGYRLVTLDRWLGDNRYYQKHLVIEPNRGPRTNSEVARSALSEIKQQQKSKDCQTTPQDRLSTGSIRYHVVFNNCESFVDRHVTGNHSIGSQVKRSLKCAGVLVAGGLMIWQRQLAKQRS